MTFEYEKALDYLLDVAYSRKISKAELCDGICDSSNFSKICSGKRKITLVLLIQLASKLNISYEKLHIYSTFDNPDEYLMITKQFKRHRSDQNFREIKKLYDNYSQIYSNANLEAKQLFTWIEGYCAMFIYLNPLHSIDLLKKAILLKKPQFSFENLNLELLNEQEFNILYDLLMAHTAHEELTLHPHYQLDYPITVCKAAIEELSQRKMIKDFSLFPSFCSMLASIYAVFKNTSFLHVYTTKGIKYCHEHSQFSSIPELYLQCVIYEKSIGNEEKALQYFYEALFLWRIQNRPSSFYRTIPYFIYNNNLNVNMEKINELLPTPILLLSSETFNHEIQRLQKQYCNKGMR